MTLISIRVSIDLELVTQKFHLVFFFELVTRKFYFNLLFRVSNLKILICLFNLI